MTTEEIEQSQKDFQVWWDNEGSRSMTKLEMHLYDQEEFMEFRCNAAWLNGAFKQKDFTNVKNR